MAARKMNLGIIRKGKIPVAHRSLVKVLVNPWLRLFGWQIATRVANKTGKLLGPCVTRCRKQKLSFTWSYRLGKDEILEKRRRLI